MGGLTFVVLKYHPHGARQRNCNKLAGLRQQTVEHKRPAITSTAAAEGAQYVIRAAGTQTATSNAQHCFTAALNDALFSLAAFKAGCRCFGTVVTTCILQNALSGSVAVQIVAELSKQSTTTDESSATY
jgi:predicted secreted protein